MSSFNSHNSTEGSSRFSHLRYEGNAKKRTWLHVTHGEREVGPKPSQSGPQTSRILALLYLKLSPPNQIVL